MEPIDDPLRLYLLDLCSHLSIDELAKLFYSADSLLSVPLKVPDDDQIARTLIKSLHEHLHQKGMHAPNANGKVLLFLSGGPRPPITD